MKQLIAAPTTLTLVANKDDVSLVLARLRGPRGPAGPSGGGGNPIVFPQSSPSALWTVVHNLGYKPAVISVLNTGSGVMDAEINHLSVNVFTVNLALPLAGTVLYK